MNRYIIEGSISIIIGNNTISKVKLKPDIRYISPDEKYALFICNIEESSKKHKVRDAKLLCLDDNKCILLQIDENLKENNLFQNIALQKLSAIFHVVIEDDKYEIVGFEYPAQL